MKAKKSLGQNFLASRGALIKIIESAKIDPKDTVLEIGPGKGFLTEAVLATGAGVVAVEKDNDLISFLEEKFKKEYLAGQLHIVSGDALTFSREKYSLVENSYILVANIPYYISGAILERFIGNSPRPKRAVLMLQKEVAERIVARNKKESILSISVKIYGIPKLIARVPAGAFVPKPKVDSAILLIENIRNPFVNKEEEEKFFTLLKLGFAHKRKKLSGNLKTLLKEKVYMCLEKSDIPPNARAEDIPLEKWLTLSKIFRTSLF